MWLIILAAAIVPVGLFLYFRMWMFRLRLLHDLRTIRATNEKIMDRISKM
jgi:lipopolysaccharide export system permease protein